jgi:hypothetical protein
MPRPLLALSAFLVLLAGAACRDSTAPELGFSAGTYVLRGIADAALPVTYHAGTDGTYSVVADTIELDGTGKAHRTFLVQVAGSAYQADALLGGRYPQEYRIDGTRFEIGSFRPCPANAICAANDTGRFIAGRLTLDKNWAGQDRRWTYERITPAQ